MVSIYETTIGLGAAMLVEFARPLPDHLVRQSRPYHNSRASKSRSVRVVSCHPLTIETTSGSIPIGTLADFLAFLGNHNTIMACPLRTFYEFLDGLLDLETFLKDRCIVDGTSRLVIGDREGCYLWCRMSNVWGTVYCTDESIPLKQAETRYLKLIRDLNVHGWHVDKLQPPGKMATDMMRQLCAMNALPDIGNGEIESLHLERAYNAFKGSRMEAAILGSFNESYNFDMNSSFMSIMKDLPSLKRMFVEWADSPVYQKDAIMGFVYCWVSIPENMPIGINATRLSIGSDSRMFFNVGETEGWRTKDEIDLIMKYDLGKVEIIEGSWGFAATEVPTPFAPMAMTVDELRHHENPDVRSLAKTIAAAAWGKFASEYPGNTLWNPMYAAEITAKVRCKLVELALARSKDLIAFTVDGIESQSNFPRCQISTEPGKFKVQHRRSLYSLSDFYRLDPNESYSWDICDTGVVIRMSKSIGYVANNGGMVGDPLDPIIVPFGSSKRPCPRNLTWKDLEHGTIPLKPPTPEECLELMLYRNAFLGDIM